MGGCTEEKTLRGLMVGGAGQGEVSRLEVQGEVSWLEVQGEVSWLEVQGEVSWLAG